MGTTNGLNKYIPETDDFERIYEVHPADVSYIMEDKKGYLWVCSLNQGYFRWNRKRQMDIFFTNGGRGESVRYSFQ